MAQSRVLLIEDDQSFRESLAIMVRRLDFDVFEADSIQSAREAIREHAPDIVMLDLDLPDGSGLELRLDEGVSRSTPFVVVSGDASTGSAQQALKQGALDYLTKPVDPAQLRSVLHGIRQGDGLRRELAQLDQELRQAGRYGELVGRSGPMQRVYELISRVSPTDAPVLVTGASGTGKELAARTIHQHSRRAQGPFLAINCGAIPESLIESELFGHAKGSFTGAAEAKQGIFERADGGTLFLDEIGEMPLELQVRLLRVLETDSITPVGGAGAVPVDVRIVAATNRAPKDAVAEGRMREDLYFRLSVFPIELPVLAERGEDILLLADHFLDALNAKQGVTKHFHPDARTLLRRRTWEGNVRELRNTVERAWILAGTEIRPSDLAGADARDASPPAVPTGAPGAVLIPLGTSAAEAERLLIEATLAHCEGNKRKTARTLGMSVKTLYNRLNAYAKAADDASPTSS